jgi:hypothetical protein
MFVEQWQSGDTTQYRILLSATDPALDLNLRTFGPLTLSLDLAQFIADFFKEIDTPGDPTWLACTVFADQLATIIA